MRLYKEGPEQYPDLTLPQVWSCFCLVVFLFLLLLLLLLFHSIDKLNRVFKQAGDAVVFIQGKSDTDWLTKCVP